MILLLTLVNIVAFAVGWMFIEVIKACFGIKVDWTEQCLRAVFAGMIFAFVMILIK